MTEERLAEIEARLSAATPGPWEWRDGGDRLTTTHRGGIHVMRFVRKGMHDAQPAFRDGHKITPVSKLDVNKCHDAQLIAHAPNDIADLIAEVRRLREEVFSLEDAVQDAEGRADTAYTHGYNIAKHGGYKI